ncbi:MAG: site-2 protease family protein, partial [Candidatus Paceibacterota bacterium]
MLTALLVIAILVFLIVVHEMGHFIAAKIFGIQVQEFGVGYPPRAITFGRWGGTEYTLNWIPFGGFVRLFGDEGETEHGRGSFVDAPRWKQAVVLVAGVCMNVVAAWALFTGAYAIGILHVIDDPSAAGARLLVTDIVPGSPADAAGVRAGDEVLDLADAKSAHAMLTPQGILNFVSIRGGQDLTVTFVHAGATTTSQLTPAHAVIAEESGRPAIGVGVALVTTESLSFAGSARAASISTYNTFFIVAGGLGKIVGDAIRGA